jgi:hypothetical protein
MVHVLFCCTHELLSWIAERQNKRDVNECIKERLIGALGVLVVAEIWIDDILCEVEGLLYCHLEGLSQVVDASIASLSAFEFLNDHCIGVFFELVLVS